MEDEKKERAGEQPVLPLTKKANRKPQRLFHPIFYSVPGDRLRSWSGLLQGRNKPFFWAAVTPPPQRTSQLTITISCDCSPPAVNQSIVDVVSEGIFWLAFALE
jgi:hypothetical protein